LDSLPNRLWSFTTTERRPFTDRGRPEIVHDICDSVYLMWFLQSVKRLVLLSAMTFCVPYILLAQSVTSALPKTASPVSAVGAARHASASVEPWLYAIDDGRDDHSSTLFRLGTSPVAGTVGLVRVGETEVENVFDIAFMGKRLIGVGLGTSFGISDDVFIEIDPETGSATEIATFKPDGDFNALEGETAATLIAATTKGEVWRINFETLQANRLGVFGGGLVSSGDLAFAADGTLYGTAAGILSDVLVKIDRTDGHASVIGTTGHTTVYGLAFHRDSGTLLAVVDADKNPKLVSINGATGATTLIGMIPAPSGITGLAVVPGTTCPIDTPKLPTDGDAARMEEGAKGRSLGDCRGAGFSLIPGYVTDGLDLQVNGLAGTVGAGLVSRNSGFRPPAYQQHFYEVKVAYEALYQRKLRNPSDAAACKALDAFLNAEIDKHCLSFRKISNVVDTSHLAVNKSEASLHTLMPSHALDLQVDASVKSVLTSRLNQYHLSLCPGDSAFHVQLSVEGQCTRKQAIVGSIFFTLAPSAKGASTTDPGVRLLLTDAHGRRVGYDASGVFFNEYPPGTADYSGDGSSGPEIDIADTGDGTYTLTASSDSAGSYELVLQSVDIEHGDAVQETISRGTMTPNSHIGPLSITVKEEVSVVGGTSPLRHRAVHP
jgi:hypothetical protein